MPLHNQPPAAVLQRTTPGLWTALPTHLCLHSHNQKCLEALMPPGCLQSVTYQCRTTWRENSSFRSPCEIRWQVPSPGLQDRCLGLPPHSPASSQSCDSSLSCCTCHQSGKLHLQVISPICILFITFAIPGCCNSLLIRLPISTFVLYSLHAHCNQRLLNMDKRLGTQTPVRTNKLLIATDTVHFPWVRTVLSPYIHSTVLCLHIGGLLCARSPALPCPAIRW